MISFIQSHVKYDVNFNECVWCSICCLVSLQVGEGLVIRVGGGGVPGVDVQGLHAEGLLGGGGGHHPPVLQHAPLGHRTLVTLDKCAPHHRLAQGAQRGALHMGGAIVVLILIF